MRTIVIDGKEYVLVPSEQLREVPPEPLQETAPDNAQSVLEDFIDPSGMDTQSAPVDDGLATLEEKKQAIHITDQGETQDVVAAPLQAPKAQPKPYSYRERFLKKKLMPSDIMTFSRIDQDFLDSNPEDPMIKADARLPKSKRLFYGPSTEQEG